MQRFSGNTLKAALALVLMLVATSFARAGVNHWSWIGSIGGSVVAGEFDRADSSRMIAIASGVIVSNDGGTTWADTWFEGKRIQYGLIAAGRSRFYVRTNDSKVLISSDDGGKSWSRNAELPNATSALAVDAQNRNVIYALIEDKPGFSGTQVVVKSTDAGVTWARLAPAGGEGSAYHMVVDPVRGGVIFIGVRSVTQPFTNAYYKSTDGGATWVALDPLLPAGALAYLSVDGSHPDTLYITRLADGRRTINLARSIDGGATWQIAATNLSAGFNDAYLLVADPGEHGTLYYAGGSVVFRSTDFGITWAAMNSPSLTSQIAVAADPARSKRLFLYSQEGLFRTEDAIKWTEITAGISARSISGMEIDEPRLIIRTAFYPKPARYDVSIDLGPWIRDVPVPDAPISAMNSFAQSLANPPWGALRYVVVQDSSSTRVEGTVSQSRLFTSGDDGATWSSKAISGVDVPETLMAVSDTEGSAVPQIMVGNYGIITCTRFCLLTSRAYVVSNDGGLAWRKVGALPAGTLMSFAIPRTGLLTQVPFIYAALSSGIARSTDGGASFQMISAQPVGGTLYVDPYRSNTLYSATPSTSPTVPPRLLRSTDGGSQWTEVAFDVALSQATGAIVDIAFSQSKSERIDVAAANGMLFRSDDAGVSWQTLSLGPGEGPNVVQFGRHEPRTAYYASHFHGVAVYTIARDAPVDVIEFYNTTLDHYFVTLSAEEALGIDRGAAGPGWVRKGVAFRAWLTGAVALSDARPVCRFYGTPGRGPNSHFYTANPAECATVKRDPGWTYEGISFHVIAAQNDQCPGSTAVYRAYNNRFARNDSNHRYSTQLPLLQAMVAQGWSVEGVAFCSPAN